MTKALLVQMLEQEVDKGTGSGMGNRETGSMWATVDMLGTTTVAEG